MRDQSTAWFRKLRQAAKEWARRFDLANPIYPMAEIRAAFVSDLRRDHPELVSHYTAKAWSTHESIIVGDLWGRVRSDVEAVFEASRYVRAPAALRVNALYPGVKDVLIRLPNVDDDVYYTELVIEHLELRGDRRLRLKENAAKSWDANSSLLEDARVLLPRERRSDRWLQNTFAA